MLGRGAMLLLFDIDAAAVAEHDDWHTHEHMPERLAIPGFLRGSRWSSVSGSPAYLVLYEVAHAEVLRSSAYLERLNAPTPWTRKMMASYRGMRRALCRVVETAGAGLGGMARVARFSSRPSLTESALENLARQPGVAGAALLESAHAAAMTAEQTLRGQDASLDWALVITGYAATALEAALDPGAGGASYRLDYVLTSTAPPR